MCQEHSVNLKFKYKITCVVDGQCMVLRMIVSSYLGYTSWIDFYRLHNATLILLLAGLHVRRGAMVEKAVQTLQMYGRQRGGSIASQDLPSEGRRVQKNRREYYQTRMGTRDTSKHRSNIFLFH